MVTTATALGNLDLHAKNIAVLHPRDGAASLAPAYAMVPWSHQNTDGEMALAIGEEYRHTALTREHLLREADTWGLPDAVHHQPPLLAGCRGLSAPLDRHS